MRTRVVREDAGSLTSENAGILRKQKVSTTLHRLFGEHAMNRANWEFELQHPR